MSRTFIKSILIAAVTVTGFSLAMASPAKAGDDDIAKLLFGATALIIIGSAINNSKAKAQTVKKEEPNRDEGRHYRKKDDGHRYRKHEDRHRYRKPDTRYSHTKILPAECMRRYRTHEGLVRLMSQYCLQDHYRYSYHLPQQCLTFVRTHQGYRKGYPMHCLRERGYSVAYR